MGTVDVPAGRPIALNPKGAAVHHDRNGDLTSVFAVYYRLALS